MTKVSFDIPKGSLDQAAKARIAELEKDLKNALNREKKLKEKVLAMQNEVRVAKLATQKFHAVVEELRFEDQYESLFIGDYA